jgi:hypothetical protein
MVTFGVEVSSRLGEFTPVARVSWFTTVPGSRATTLVC